LQVARENAVGLKIAKAHLMQVVYRLPKSRAELRRDIRQPALMQRLAAIPQCRGDRRGEAIFVYVGAEVSIGSIMTNYIMQASVLGLVAERAGRMVSLYWGGAMIGRFIGSYVLQRLKPGYVLAACAMAAGALALLSSISTGATAAYSLIAVGLFNSIMFPTIFALASEELGDETPNGSALLCMAIVGGAIVPVLARWPTCAIWRPL
jgi:fucose permease